MFLFFNNFTPFFMFVPYLNVNAMVPSSCYMYIISISNHLSRIFYFMQHNMHAIPSPSFHIQVSWPLQSLHQYYTFITPYILWIKPSSASSCFYVPVQFDQNISTFHALFLVSCSMLVVQSLSMFACCYSCLQILSSHTCILSYRIAFHSHIFQVLLS